jgi:hypothetical protein
MIRLAPNLAYPRCVTAWCRLFIACGLCVAGCGGGADLDDFLPPAPAPDGTARSVWAGVAASEADLVAGPARSGVLGDVYLKNERVHFVVQAATRVIGVIPWGGNLVDGALLGGQDQIGEVSLVYQIGRTCAHERLEVLRDGEGGGPAVVRAIGRTAPNDGINLKGIGAIPVPTNVDADVEDGATCATTYTLRPGAVTLEVAWTIFNPNEEELAGPIGVLSDVGGEIEVFVPRLGFQSLGGSLGDVLSDKDLSTPFVVYQAPGSAWGLIPRIGALRASGFIVSGASFVIFGIAQFLEVIDPTKFALHVPPKTGVTTLVEIALGRDAAAIEAEVRRGESLTEVTGNLPFSGGRPRVTFFQDVGGDGQLDATDPSLFYLDAADDGTIRGRVPPGSYLVRAEVPDLARSPTVAFSPSGASATLPAALALAAPARIDYTVTDDGGGAIPAKLILVGPHPAPPDARVAATSERRFGVVRVIHAAYGTSDAPGTDPSDPPLLVPAGGPYRLFVSRGPEWSMAAVDLPAVAAGAEVVLPASALERVVDTTGYVATAFHEHAINSPDSAVPMPARVRSLAVEGIELFAGTDHDRLADYAPVVAALGLGDVLKAVVGVETTPFVFGHFIAFPLAVDPAHPSGGALDWAAGVAPFARRPTEIFAGLREQGARVVQVCHPRGDTPGFGTFQAYFDRAALTFDFGARTAVGVPERQPVPLEWFRLPEDQAFYSDEFDAIEIWNNHSRRDVDEDGQPDFFYFERSMTDWMNYLSLGRVFAPIANGDTHGGLASAAGLPRTLVRVADDTVSGLNAGGEEEVWQTLSGNQPRDVILTNGPMVRVTSGGQPAIGRVLAASGGSVTVEIDVTSADWVEFDTVELYANATFDTPRAPLVPVRCFTSRTGLDPKDPCAKPGPQPLVVNLEATPGGGSRRRATVSVTLVASDIPTRAGKTGEDAWLVARVRGRRSLFPMLPEGVITDEATLGVLTTGAAPWNAALAGRGVPATALTGPILLDFDGGGWRAPFQP